MDRLLRWFMLASVLFASVSAAWAANPRVSLKLQDATATEAVAALSKAAGVTVEIYRPEPQPGMPVPVPDPILEEKANFDWTDVTLATALRQLCQRYGLRPSQGVGGGFTLHSAAGLPPAPGKRVGLSDKNGVRVWVRSITVDNRRSVNFEGGFGGNDTNRLSMTLGIQLLTGAADTLAGVDNLTAMDDQGNLLTGGRSSSRGGIPFAFPDEGGAFAYMGGPHPRAKKLTWVEGDLFGYKFRRVHRVEIPLPLDEKTATATVADVTIQVSRFEADAGDVVPGVPEGGPTLEARIVSTGDSLLGSDDRINTPFLIGKSGERYSASAGSSGGSATLHRINAQYRAIPEPVVKALFFVTEKGEVEKIGSFRLTNVPLPPETVFVPRQAEAPRPREGARPPERPYFEKGGGVLVSRVQIAGKPAPAGKLAIGLAAREGAGWSTLRWTDVAVDADGNTRLEDLKPGAYRLLRRFTPTGPLQVSGAGRWLNAETQVEIAAGKEAVPPLLQWTADPTPGKPVAPPRPPAKRPR